MKWFKLEDFECSCCGEDKMEPTLLDMIDDARDRSGIPFIVNSGFRCKKHNASLPGSSPTSSHLKGYAVDIKCTRSRQRFKMFKALIEVGFNRILVYPAFFHVDIDPDKSPEILVLM